MQLAVGCACALFAASSADAITIGTSYVGDPGNAADTSTYGSVSYGYNIATYDVTLSQYAEFLNSVAASDPHVLYTTQLGANSNVDGITRSGTKGTYQYTVFGGGQRPVTWVDWYDAARFTNWLTNGQGSADTEHGVYSLSGVISVAPLPADHSALVGTGTKWFLPTQDEWYKAAYYKGGGPNAGYWAYPFQSDSQPSANQTPGGANSANFNNGVYAVSQSTMLVSGISYLTDVGAYTSALSPYGASDMGGDVFQWNESLFSGTILFSYLRGGAWDLDASYLAASYQDLVRPSFMGNNVGFRIASISAVPEPSSITLVIVGAIGLWCSRKRRNRNPT